MKVAVIQHPPEYLNLPKSIKLGVELIQTAAEKGVKLIVFPEAWFPGYPEYVWRLKPGGEMSLTDDLFKISQANSVNLSKGHMKPASQGGTNAATSLIDEPASSNYSTQEINFFC